MNRIATMTDPKADQCQQWIDSEWVLGNHLIFDDLLVRNMFLVGNHNISWTNSVM